VTKHAQTTLNLSVEVDTEMAPLIRGLWDLGLVTLYSCQQCDMISKSYIVFVDEMSALIFRELSGLQNGACELAICRGRYLAGKTSARFDYRLLSEVTRVVLGAQKSEAEKLFFQFCQKRSLRPLKEPKSGWKRV